MKTFKITFGLLPVFAVLLAVSLALAGGADGAALHGMAPLFGDKSVPLALLPPGADDNAPSDVVFPQQQIPIRFNHAKHMTKDVGAGCKTCHGAAYKSKSSNDRLTPSGEQCDACHSTDHGDLAHVKAGDEAMGQCTFCHLGYKAGAKSTVAPLSIPRANLVFDHKVHAARNIACPQCHGAIDKIELATRDQLPRMRGCFDCHQNADSASQGDAKSACDTCHPGGGATGTAIQTMFSSGTLEPPRWLHNAEHTPDFIERHKTVAADDSQFCANCHKEDFCTDCHDGRVRPRTIHPNDYLNMHAIEARMETQKCQSCHREQSFCLDCHMRVGVSESSPLNAKDSARFHPPKSIWSDPPRKPGSHSFEAERNLNQCVSCHTERDCVACHGAANVGPTFDPHQAGFKGGCANQFRRNPRPCFVCHQSDDMVLQACR
jgi:hypothetical protein